MSQNKITGENFGAKIRLSVYLGVLDIDRIPVRILERGADAGERAADRRSPEPHLTLEQRAPVKKHAAGDAGLTRGLIAASAGLVFWLVIGTAVVRWYDSKGLHRLPPEVLAHVQRSVGEYQAAQAAQAADGPADSPQRSPSQ